MEHYPAYDFQKCLDESSLVLSGLYLEIPGIEYRRVWPTLQLLAFYGNSQGGKSFGKKMDEAKAFRVHEFLPSWAIPGAMRQELEKDLRLAPHHCWALSTALQDGDLRNASWLVQIVASQDSLERIHEVAELYAGLPTEEAG